MEICADLAVVFPLIDLHTGKLVGQETFIGCGVLEEVDGRCVRLVLKDGSSSTSTIWVGFELGETILVGGRLESMCFSHCPDNFFRLSPAKRHIGRKIAVLGPNRAGLVFPAGSPHSALKLPDLSRQSSRPDAIGQLMSIDGVVLGSGIPFAGQDDHLGEVRREDLDGPLAPLTFLDAETVAGELLE